ncbi:TPA: hypothetical protein N0F65_003612 [Lagenidium giganteum]|uniref:Fucosyltransferase n=1 Tax=Lagenidium giganteum TaxID=4803 RepID=A0AAV2Z145_9STRA|nr:TPA: hypothetical protein N0F65_003612 [Lagenidium giganteum]
MSLVVTAAELPQLSILYPVAGSFEALPIQFRIQLLVDDGDTFLQVALYCCFQGDGRTALINEGRHCTVCVEIDGEVAQCNPLVAADLVLDDLLIGNHTARMRIQNDTTGAWLDSATDAVSFEVVDKATWQARTEQLNSRLHPPEQELVDWAASHAHTATMAVSAGGDFVQSTQSVDLPHKLLVIGVKTSLESGFPYRQAIRQTWGHALPPEINLFFLGGVPSSHARLMSPGLQHALAVEKRTFGDLLTTELNVEDSYDHLVQHVNEFLALVTEGRLLARYQYIMIADDDIYLRVPELVDLLRRHGSPRRFYAGQVWSTQFNKPVRPQRHPQHKNYIPEDSYPMSELPPFANGPHYVLSSDCAEFIARNREWLAQPGSSLDDVSVALWLMGIQVHAQHWQQFQNLRDTICVESLVSYADLSTTALRRIHSNLEAQQPFCDGFDLATWLRPVRLPKRFVQGTPASSMTRQLHASVELGHDTQVVLVRTTVLSEVDGSEQSVMYNPGVETLVSHCERVCAVISAGAERCSCHDGSFLTQLQEKMLAAWAASRADHLIEASRLALWHHNVQMVLQPSTSPPVKIVAYSPMARYARILLECLFADVFIDDSVLVIADHDLPQLGRPPDVFVFSILDGGCGSEWSSTCQQVSQQYIDHYAQHNASLMMISCEAWPVTGLDERVLLLSTIAQSAVASPRRRFAYLSMASLSFAERNNGSPRSLLQPRAAPISTTPRRFCAYMYARCDRPQREYMFDYLNALEPVDALGACQGAGQAPEPAKRAGRVSAWYNDDAVQIFEGYKFVIAFENAEVDGYVTEKLVNAFLAGAIPIYLGHSDTVTQLFNPRSFIDCGSFARLKDCAQRVLNVHRSQLDYEEMRREQPIINMTAFNAAFSWHPDVPSTHLADLVAHHVSRSRLP